MRALEMLVVIGVVAIAILVPFYFLLKKHWIRRGKEEQRKQEFYK